MPELPEVETVACALQNCVAGCKIERVRLARADLRTPFPPDFAKKLAGRRIDCVSRRAKYLLFSLSGGMTLIAHLGMSGCFITADGKHKNGKHDHVFFTLDDGRMLIYRDPRRFGLMALSDTKHLEKHPLLAHLGPEPFSKEFNAAYLKAALASRKGPIKPVLMDQELVVGVGNIYASEALFLAGIDPRTPAHKAASKAALLIKSIRKVLADAIESGGSSLRDFVNISGETGYFQHRFNVYERAQGACFTCGSQIQTLRQAGRSTFYCPACQG